ncbi:MAG TPA: AI-2E family transporter [Opitutaceae bacterium]|nr:AI-2E family transporter [Opitutaceae bacterium]
MKTTTTKSDTSSGGQSETDSPKRATTPRSAVLAVFVAAALFIVIQSFALLAPILLSLLLILLISLAVNPVILRIRDLTGGRAGATALLMVSVVGILSLTGWAFFGPMKASVDLLMDKAPAYWERLQKPLIKMEQKAKLSEKKLQAEVTTEIAEAATAAGEAAPVIEPATSALEPPKETGSFRSGLGEMFQGAFGKVTSGAFNAAQFFIVLITVFFGVTFTLMNPRPIFGAMFSMIPEQFHGRALVIVQRIGRFVPRWAGATLLGMLTIGVLVFLLMWPIFGFTDALVLGLIAGVLEAIPFIGPVLSAVPALLLAVGTGGMTPLWVLLAYVAVQSLENNVILPYIMARGMQLHPVAVIFSMLLCVAAFGVLGVLVAAPLVAIVSIVHDELFRKRFLPSVTDEGLDRLARKALNEKVSDA